MYEKKKKHQNYWATKLFYVIHLVKYIETYDKILNDCRYPLPIIQAAQNQKQTNTRGLGNLIHLKIDAKVILTTDINIQGCLINGQVVDFSQIDISQNSVQKINDKFSHPQAGLKCCYNPS